MVARLFKLLVLPHDVTAFERSYLLRMNKVALGFFLVHVPVFMAVAALCGTGVIQAGLLTSFALLGPLLAHLVFKSPRAISVMYGFTAMCLGSLLVHFGQGPMQIEMHFYFFVLIALLAVFANPVVILAAAGTVVVQHLVLYFMMPRSVFNYDASVWAVLVHALFVVIESVAACFVARSFFDNVIGLERIVATRTAELDARNADMRVILEHVGQGFLSVSIDGALSAERSACVERWLGVPAPNTTFWDYLGTVDREVGRWFKLGWEALLEDVLPLELAIDQLPKRLDYNHKHFRLTYRPLLDDKGVIVKAVVIITDVTAELDSERAENEQREILHVFERVLKDKAGFLEFYVEGDDIVRSIAHRTARGDELQLRLHTLKGTAGIFGLSSVAACCHNIEQAMAATGEPPTDVEIQALTTTWGAAATRLNTLLGERSTGRIELDDEDYEAVLGAVVRGEPGAEVAAMMMDWRLEPASRRLGRVAEHARGLAERLGKPALTVDVDASGVRLESAPWASFWGAFVHAVRNSVDHGIEMPEARLASGKAPAGRISLRAFVDNGKLVIEIEDDGRGVDLAAVEARARSLGLPHDTREQVLRSIFHHGLSTRETVSELSGRGVGLSALERETTLRGGTVSIQSDSGKGTVLRFSFPIGPSMRGRPRKKRPSEQAPAQAFVA